MKKFLVLIIFSLFTLFSISAMAQNQQDQDSDTQQVFSQMERFMKMQRKMMEQAFKALDENMGMMESTPGQSFFGLGGGMAVDAFEQEWQDQGDKKVLLIKPKSEDNNLNIEVKNGRVRVHGKIVKKEEHKGQGGVSQSTSIRSFSSSITVPRELDAERVEISSRDGVIYLSFPYRDGSSAKQLDPDKGTLLRPLRPDEGDITL